MNALEQKYLGHYARSIESGWVGKVIAIEGEFLKMQGVNELTRLIAGGGLDDHLEPDDVQWFVPEDVELEN